MTADIAALAPERFTLWFNSAAEPVEKALAAMTAGRGYSGAALARKRGRPQARGSR
jgi:hypothetical protein